MCLQAEYVERRALVAGPGAARRLSPAVGCAAPPPAGPGRGPWWGRVLMDEMLPSPLPSLAAMPAGLYLPATMPLVALPPTILPPTGGAWCLAPGPPLTALSVARGSWRLAGQVQPPALPH